MGGKDVALPRGERGNLGPRKGGSLMEMKRRGVLIRGRKNEEGQKKERKTNADAKREIQKGEGGPGLSTLVEKKKKKASP